MNSIGEVVNHSFPLCLQVNRQKKHASFVLYKKRIISIGFNHFKTHPKARKLGYMFDEMHSELDAFRKIPKCFLDKKLVLVNVRYNKNGEMRMSKPCHICESWCREIFHKIYYTDNEGIKELEIV
jgi:hypothetical protein